MSYTIRAQHHILKVANSIHQHVSINTPATTVLCTTDVEALDGILGALVTHKFVFAQLMGLANALPILFSHCSLSWLVVART
jgi:hypothetical protein